MAKFEIQTNIAKKPPEAALPPLATIPAASSCCNHWDRGCHKGGHTSHTKGMGWEGCICLPWASVGQALMGLTLGLIPWAEGVHLASSDLALGLMPCHNLPALHWPLGTASALCLPCE